MPAAMSKSFLVLFFKKEHSFFVDSLRLLILAALPLAGLLVGPAYATLAWAFGVVGILSTLCLPRPRPVPDLLLAALATVFCVLCVLGAIWSIAPARSLHAAAQLALILAASLVVLSDRSVPPALAARAFGAITLMLCVGVALMCADRALHFPLERHFAGGTPFPGTKYNRGEDYLTLLLWPLLAYWTLARQYRRAMLVLVCVVLAAIVGLSTTARITLPAGLLILMAAGAAPLPTLRFLACGTATVAVLLPLLLRALAADRALFWRHLKQSGLHRLEIWDYMTARVAERPWFGWGFSTAKLVPIRPSEQSGFAFVDPHGVYPHNQLLQLWLETGAAGVAVGMAFVLLVLWRISRLPPRLLPFACAAYAAALSVSASSFELTTDSWWAALALTAVLLRLAGEAALP